MALTAKFVATAKPGRHLDADGLYLNVSPTGRKTWVLRFSSKGRVTERSLGSGEFVSLAEAREKAFTMRKAIRTGQPIDKVKAQTFKEVAEDVNAGAKLHRFPEQKCINNADENGLEHGLFSWASGLGRIVGRRVGVVAA